MKIDTEVIKQVLYAIDATAKEDPEFVELIDFQIYQMEKKQKKINTDKNRKG